MGILNGKRITIVEVRQEIVKGKNVIKYHATSCSEPEDIVITYTDDSIELNIPELVPMTYKLVGSIEKRKEVIRLLNIGILYKDSICLNIENGILNGITTIGE